MGADKDKEIEREKTNFLTSAYRQHFTSIFGFSPSFSQFAGSLLAGTYTGDQMKNVDSKITGSSESTLEIKNYTGVGNVFLLHFSAP